MLQASLLRVAAYGTPLVLILAAVFFGSDHPASALMFSLPVLTMSSFAILSREMRFERIDFIIALLFLAFTAYSGFRGWLSTGAPEYAALLAGLALFMAARTIGSDADRGGTVWVYTLVLLTALSFAAFLDHTISPERLFWIDHPYSGVRLSSPFLSANTAATLHGMTGLMAISFMLSSASHKAMRQRTGLERALVRYALPLAAVLISSTALFLTGSRAGISLFLAGAAILLLAYSVMIRDAERQKPFFLVGGVAMVLVSLLLIFSISGGVFSDRLPDVFAGGESPRAIIFQAYMDALSLAPLFGNGLGGFEYINALIARADNAQHIMHQGAAHNLILQWGLQAGGTGIIILLGVWFWLFLRLWTGFLQRRRRRNEILAALVIAGFVFLHGMTDYALEIPGFMWIFMWIMGLAAGMSRLRGTRDFLSGRGFDFARLVFAAGLSASFILIAMAMEDRVAAQSIASMDEDMFRERYSIRRLDGSARHLVAVGDRALILTDPDIGLALAAYQGAIEAEPRDGILHAKFSYAALVGGAMPEALDALAQSYLRMPYAPRHFRQWRLSLGGALFSSADLPLREAILRETRLLSDRQRDIWLQQYVADNLHQ